MTEIIKEDTNETEEKIITGAKIEAILFAAGCPVKYEKIANALLKPQAYIEFVVRDYLKEQYINRGIELICYDDSCVLCTKSEYEADIKLALDLKRSGTFSNSSLEVLAIIARNQPVTKTYIEQVRGVDSSYAVSSLLDKGFISIAGKLDVPGKPNLYEVTESFMRCFGINSLEEIEKLEISGGESKQEQ